MMFWRSLLGRMTGRLMLLAFICGFALGEFVGVRGFVDYARRGIEQTRELVGFESHSDPPNAARDAP